MANPKASILITLKDNASKAFTGIKNKAKAFENGLNSSLDVVKRWTVRGLALTAAVTGLGSIFTSAAGKVEQWRVRFETMADTAEEGRKELEELTELAKSSPFDMPQVVEGAARLNAMGFETEELTERMRMLGDITAGVGTEKMPQLVLAFGQVKTAGRLTGQELRQFNEAGVDLLSELATMFGKTKSEIKDMVSEGKIGFKDVDQALKNMTSEGGRFFGLMDKLSDTFLGKVSNIKDNFFQIAVAIGQELLPEVSDLTDSIQDFTDKESNIKNIALRFKQVFMAVRAVTISLTKMSGTAVLSFLKFELAVTKVSGALVKGFGKIKEFFGVAKGSTEEFINFTESEIERMERNLLQNDADLKAGLAKSEAEWVESFKQFQEKKKEVAELKNKEILEDTEQTNNELQDSHVKLFETINNGSKNASDNITNNLVNAFDLVSGTIKEVETNAKKVLEALDTLLTGGSLEARIDSATKAQARRIRDIEKSLLRGEITQTQALKNRRDAAEDFIDSIQDIKDSAIDASKVRLTDALDPIAATARIVDANNAMSRTNWHLNKNKELAEEYNNQLQIALNNERAITEEKRKQSQAEPASNISSFSTASLTNTITRAETNPTRSDNSELINAINKMSAKLDKLTVNVDVSEISMMLTKNITQFQNLNDKGRI